MSEPGPQEQRLPEAAPPLDQAMPGPLPELSRALQERMDETIQVHIGQLRSQLPRTRAMSDEHVSDDLDKVLEAMAAILADPQQQRSLRLLAPAHGIARHAQGFTLTEVLQEYVLLRRVLQRELQAGLGRPFSETESESLNDLVTLVANAVVLSYVGQKEKQIRLEAETAGSFLASLTHDLRNDLNGAMMAMQMSGETLGDVRDQIVTTTPEKADLADPLQHAIRELTESRGMMERTLQTMTRLLEAEQMRVGAVSIQPQEAAVKPLLDSISRSAARNARRVRTAPPASTKGSDAVSAEPGPIEAKIEVECDEGIVVKTDYDLLSTILLNLTGNAVKYAGGSRIILRAQKADPPLAIRIDVVDHGPGIPEDQQAHLFDRFHRGTHEDKDGFGLGLFIVRRAATLLGAEVSVDSTVGKGSTFTVLLPAHPPRNPTTTSDPSS